MSASEPSIGGDQWDLEGLCDRDVGRVVRAEVVAQLPDANEQTSYANALQPGTRPNTKRALSGRQFDRTAENLRPKRVCDLGVGEVRAHHGLLRERRSPTSRSPFSKLVDGG